MSDEQSPEANLSKRERQKARRAQRLEAERAAATSAQRRRLAGFVVVGVLIAGAVGYFVQQNLAERAQERDLIAGAQARLDELGCTPDEEMPPLGAGHFDGPELVGSPPGTVYEHLPTTSGKHIGSVAVTGVYDEHIDERLTTHNLEHGYVVMWYAEDADPAQVDDLKAFAQERIDDGDDELIVAMYNQAMDGEAKFGFVSWERRQLCGQFDEGIALNFVNEHMNNPRAPEAFAGPHLGGQPGELDPNAEDGPLLFPPQGQEGVDEGLGHDEDQVDSEESEEES